MLEIWLNRREAIAMWCTISAKLGRRWTPTRAPLHYYNDSLSTRNVSLCTDIINTSNINSRTRHTTNTPALAQRTTHHQQRMPTEIPPSGTLGPRSGIISTDERVSEENGGEEGVSPVGEGFHFGCHCFVGGLTSSEGGGWLIQDPFLPQVVHWNCLLFWIFYWIRK